MSRAKFVDVYDEMDDHSFSEYVADLFAAQKPVSVPISLRMPEDLLARVRKQADLIDIPYQTLIKRFVELGSEGFDKARGTARKPKVAVAKRAARTPAKKVSRRR